MISAVLIDEEPDALDALQIDLKTHCPEIKILGAFSNVKIALDMMPKLEPELIFLNVPFDAISVFDLLKRPNSFKGKVICVTTADASILDAVKFRIRDYLHKPLDPATLKQAIEKFKKDRDVNPRQQGMNALSRETKRLSLCWVKEKVAIATPEGMEILLLDEINYLQALRNCTLIKRSGGRDVKVAKSLRDFEQFLPDTGFMRVHRSFLINLFKIQRYVRFASGHVIMEDGTKITLSRNYKRKLINYLKALVA